MKRAKVYVDSTVDVDDFDPFKNNEEQSLGD